MNYFKHLSILQLTLLRNKYWRNLEVRKNTTISTFIAVAIIILFAYLFKSHVLSAIIQPNLLTDPVLGRFVFSFVMLFTFFTSLVSSMSYLIPVFYRSPELNYLFALPIPPKHIFIFKLIVTLFVSSFVSIFLNLVILIGIGWSIGALWYYYIMLLPVYFTLAFLSSGIGLFAGMLMLRFMTATMFNYVAGGLSFITPILWVVSATRFSPEFILSLLNRLVEHLSWMRFIPYDVVPVFAAGSILHSLAVADTVSAIRPLLILVLTGITAVAVILIAAQYLFLKGWLLTQSAESVNVNRSKKQVFKGNKKSYSPVISTVSTEFLYASRNRELIFLFVVTLVGFASMLFVFLNGTLTSLLGVSPYVGLMLIILYSAIILPVGIDMLFLPTMNQMISLLDADKDAIKLVLRTKWLLKLLPFAFHEIIFIELSKQILVPFFLGVTGIFVYVAFSEIHFAFAFLATVGFALLLAGTSIRSIGISFRDSALRNNTNPIASALFGLLIPIIYYVLATGPLLFYMLGSIPYFAQFQFPNSLIVGIALWVITSLVSICIGLKLASKYWNKIEIL